MILCSCALCSGLTPSRDWGSYEGVIYWDNNATTPLAPEVYEAMEPFLKERFFNPSAGYGCARHVREAVEEARAALYLQQARKLEIENNRAEGCK